MKHHPKDYFLSVTAGLAVVLRVFLLTLFGLLCHVNFASAQSVSQADVINSASGNVIEIVEGDYIYFQGIEPPDRGWEAASHPNIDHTNKTGQHRGEYRSMVGRFYFDRAAVGDGLLGIHTIGTRGNFTVSVNGVEIFRNFADVADKKNSWYRPFLVPVPDSALKTDVNEVIVHSFSRKSVGIGRLLIGPNSSLQSIYQSRYFWHITAPTAASLAMLVIGLLFLVFWIAQRHEIELLWLSIASILWFARNHQYFSGEIPINTGIYVAITFLSSYFATVAATAFYFYFIQLRHRKLIVSTMLFFGCLITLIHFGIIRPPSNPYMSASSFYLYAGTLIVVITVSTVALRDLFRNRELQRRLIGLGVVMCMPLVTIHDVTMLFRHLGDGHATYLGVFGGPTFAMVFTIAFGIRVLKAFTDLGKSNQVLETSMSKVRAELLESEANRQELVVSQTLTSERARLMQEMHDGIGSNLITALAVAQQQKHPRTSIDVLRRALGDLKLTVDSLEPVEGDLVALLGNLRHRMARDMADAGVSCKWEVEECQSLPWLDAANALHVLRIHNEAIGNVLSHSNADEMRIGCVEHELDGVRGILTYVKDNGDGFALDDVTNGKGLLNMKARAHSLHGALFFESEPGMGTSISLWLPYVREEIRKIDPQL